MANAYIVDLLRAINVLESHMNIGENYTALQNVIADFPTLQLISIFGEASDVDIETQKDAVSDAYNALVDSVNDNYDYAYIRTCITALRAVLTPLNV